VTVIGQIHYWASSSTLVATDVPINFYVTPAGGTKTRIGQTTMPSLSTVGPDNGTGYVYATWRDRGGQERSPLFGEREGSNEEAREGAGQLQGFQRGRSAQGQHGTALGAINRGRRTASCEHERSHSGGCHELDSTGTHGWLTKRGSRFAYGGGLPSASPNTHVTPRTFRIQRAERWFAGTAMAR